MGDELTTARRDVNGAPARDRGGAESLSTRLGISDDAALRQAHRVRSALAEARRQILRALELMAEPPGLMESGDAVSSLAGPHEGAEVDGILVDVVTASEQLGSAVAGLRVRACVAFRTRQLARQRALGVPRARLGRGIAEQLGLARNLSPTTAGNELALDRVLVDSLPRTLALLEGGEISPRAARGVAAGVLVLDDPDRHAIDEELAGQLPSVHERRAGELARALADERDPEAAVKRMRRAAGARSVSLRPVADGTCRLSILTTTVQGVSAFKALDQAAGSARATGDERGRGQIMADAAIERITGRADPAGVDVELQLLMTDEALLGASEETAWLEGRPIPAALARRLALGAAEMTGAPRETVAARETDAADGTGAGDATGAAREAGAGDGTRLVGRAADASSAPGSSCPGDRATPDAAVHESARRWIRRLYTDPSDGTLRAADPTRRLFTGEVRRFLLLRDGVCRTPGCGAPIRHLHHVRAHADGGPTTADNGAGLCERMNYVLEMPGWSSRMVADPRTGGPAELEIITPTGHAHRSAPPRLRRVRGPSGEGDAASRAGGSESGASTGSSTPPTEPVPTARSSAPGG